MTAITQDILNQVFREYMKTVDVATDTDKDVKIASLIPKFEHHVNQLTSEYKGFGGYGGSGGSGGSGGYVGSVGYGGSAPMVRRLRNTMRNRAPVMFRRATRRSRGWWLPSPIRPTV